MKNLKALALLALTTAATVGNAVQAGGNNQATCRLEKNGRIELQMPCRIDTHRNGALITWADGAVDKFTLVDRHNGTALLTDGAGGYWKAGMVGKGNDRVAWFAHQDGVRAVYVF